MDKLGGLIKNDRSASIIYFNNSVIIIDDDLDVLEVMSYALKNEGFKVICFTNAQVGLEELKKISPRPGLIIMLQKPMELEDLLKVVRAHFS